MNFIVSLDENYVIMIYVDTNQKRRAYTFEIVAILDNDILLIQHILSIMRDYVFVKRDDGYIVADNYEDIYLHRIILAYYAQYDCNLFTLMNNRYQINHKSSNKNCNKKIQLLNKSDNRLCNLEIVTDRDNKAHFNSCEYEVAMTSSELISIQDEVMHMKSNKYSKLIKRYMNNSEHNIDECLCNEYYDEEFFDCMYVNFKNKKYKLLRNKEFINRAKDYSDLKEKIFNIFVEQFIINNSNDSMYVNNERLYNFIIYRYFSELIFQYDKNRAYRLLFNNLIAVLNKYDSKEYYRNLLNKYSLLDDSINQDKYICIDESYNLIKKYLYESRFLKNNKLDKNCIANKLYNLESEIYIDKHNNKLLDFNKKILIDLSTREAIHIMKKITINITDKLVFDASAEKLMIIDLENHIVIDLKNNKIVDFNNKHIIELNKANLKKYDFYNKFLRYIRNYTDAEFFYNNTIVELYNYIIARLCIASFNKNNLLCNIVVNCLFPINAKYQRFYSLYDIEMLNRMSVCYKEDSNLVSAFSIPRYTTNHMNNTVLVEAKKLYKQDLSSIKRVAIGQNEGKDKVYTVYKSDSVVGNTEFDDILVEDIERAISTTLLSELYGNGFITFDSIQEEVEAYRAKTFSEYCKSKEVLEKEGIYDEADNLEYKYKNMRAVNRDDISYVLQNVTSLKNLLENLKLEIICVSDDKKQKIINYKKKKMLESLNKRLKKSQKQLKEINELQNVNLQSEEVNKQLEKINKEIEILNRHIEAVKKFKYLFSKKLKSRNKIITFRRFAK